MGRRRSSGEAGVTASPEGTEAGVDVTICVPTYGRPAGLARLLAALQQSRLERLPGLRVEILVVDNNPDGSAIAPVEAARRAGGWPIRHIQEPKRGVASARNAAIRATGGSRFIAFIDDDETAEPDWLEELVLTQARTGADVVTGAVLPKFDCRVPDWVIEGGFYERPRYPTGTRVQDARTGNVLMRRSLFDEASLSFDEELSLIGGEDTILFQKILLRGYTIVWADEAVAYEHYAQGRVDLRWLLRRWYRTGNVDARLFGLRHPSRFALPLNVARGAGRVLVGGALFLAALVTLGRGKTHRIVAPLYTVCRGLGILGSVARMDYREYRGSHGA